MQLSTSTALEKMLPMKVVTNELMGQTLRKVVPPTKEQKEILKAVDITPGPVVV